VHTSSGRHCDVALVRKLKPTKKWHPKTVWNGCKVLEECDSMLIMMQYIVRGVLVVHAALAGGRQFYYRDDAFDNDAFCRFNSL
jgi:hypothetical protein